MQANHGTCGHGGMADAIDLGSIGQPWRFESSCPHQKKTNPSRRKDGFFLSYQIRHLPLNVVLFQQP